MMLTAGETFAGYRIISRIATSEMGEVYLAHQPESARHDELHVLPAELTNDAEYRQRFDRASALSHPNLPDVYGQGATNGRLWIATEFLDGSTAADLLRHRHRAGLPEAEVLTIVKAVASALDEGHRRGLIHRRVTPSTILITDHQPDTARIHLTGFGVAPRVEDTPGLTAGDTDLDAVTYAAPELLIGEPVDGRADQYALACTAFHLLTGSVPYPSSNSAAIINKHVMAPPASIGGRRAELTRLNGVFATAMAKDAHTRYPSCRDFADDLERRLSTPAEHVADQDDRAAAGPAPTVDVRPMPVESDGSTSRTGVRIKRRWWRRGLSGEPWSRRKVTVALLASVGILAILLTTFAAMVTPLLAGNSGQAAQRSTATRPMPTAPPVIGRPLVVRPVLGPPLQPQPDQCPAVPSPVPPPPDTITACAVDNAAVYQLGPVALQLNLTGATSARVPTSEFYTVQMSMDAASSGSFAQYTAANIGGQLAFVRDGVVLAAPSISQPITGETLQISGELNADTAGSIARLLRDGT